MQTKVLVTGGAGFIGSQACKALAAAGITPVTFDNLTTGHRAAVRWGPLEIGDIRDHERVSEVLRLHQPSAVMHFAALIAAGESVEQPDRYHDNNVTGTRSLLTSMVGAGVDKLVFSSSAAVYGDQGQIRITEDLPLSPDNPYGETKRLVELMLQDFGRTHGMRSISLRCFNAAGADPDGELGENHEPKTHIIPLTLQAAREGRPIKIFGSDYPTKDGTCVRDYVHVSDLIDAHLLALKKLRSGPTASVYNLGNGHGCSVLDIVESAKRVTGLDIAVEFAARRPGDTPMLVADASRAGKQLQWRPRYSDIDQQIRHAWQWHLSGFNLSPQRA